MSNVHAFPDSWRARLVCTLQGAIKSRATRNFYLFLANHPAVAGIWRWNAFSYQVMAVKPGPWDDRAAFAPHELTENDHVQAMMWLEAVDNAGLAPRLGEVRQALRVVAAEHPVHPIRDYLMRLHWDGTERLAGLPKTWFASGDDAIYGTFFKIWMVCLVARVFEPGCQADYSIFLVGRQGLGKTWFLRTLATIDGVVYHTDTVHDIETKEGAMGLSGKLIIEFAELSALQRKGPDAIKAFLTRTTDHYRPPYGFVHEDHERQSMICGTFNPSGLGFLRDPTGARRFWPIPVNKQIDIKEIEEIRDQLWAEAVHLYGAKCRRYLTPDETIAAAAVTNPHQERDVWWEPIEDFVLSHQSEVAGKTVFKSFTTINILNHFDVPRKEQDEIKQRRIARVLTAMGYIPDPEHPRVRENVADADEKGKKEKRRFTRKWIHQDAVADAEKKNE